MSNTDGTSGIAYAHASWARFDEEVSDELLRAVCGAFALVSAADGSVSPSEVERFSEVLADTSARFPSMDFAKIDGLFRQLGQAILSDPEGGRQRVLRLVAAVRDDPQHRDLVRSAALIAIEADGRTLDSEEAVLAEIAEALGL